jgi:ubiquinone biosynthesis protein Coq4
MSNLTFEEFYSDKINGMTLQEALDMHYAINPQFTPWDQFDQEVARNLIKSHDISHVVFGSDTSYMGELIVQSWNKYGANLNITITAAPKYLLNKHLRTLVLPTRLIPFALTHIGAIIHNRGIVKTQAAKMTKKWEYFQEDKYMNTTIGDIRSEYGIDIKLPI